MGKSISNLKHTHLKTSGGASVYVLNTGAIIDPESTAMLQALHSRSVGGFESHLNILKEKGADKFMSSFYVGYGHKSIGDCGTTTLFIEGVSMLAAKAIQDFPLYNGQEASTRYIDFSKQKFLDPTNSKEGKKLLEVQRKFYLDSLSPIKEMLKEIHPQKEGEKDSIYEKAINARAFDIARSFLPAGASTNLAWHTNLRQISDRLLFLRNHPLKELRDIAETIEKAVKKAHPNSFGHKRYEATESYQNVISKNYYYHNPFSPKDQIIRWESINENHLEAYRELFEKRPPKTELPKYLGQIGNITVEFQLDFGSFRDIQRHRAINQRMPLLTTELGFNEWYVKNLPESVKSKLSYHLTYIKQAIEELNLSKEDAQYFIPMGFNTANKFTGDLPASIYMIELRDSRFVHPTLQKVAHKLGKEISNRLQIPIHVDPEPNRFDVKRGEQDIVRK